MDMDVIGLKSSFSGDFNFGKYVRVEGHLTGTIDSEGILITGERSNIEAELNGNIVIINGRFEGSITAANIIVLEPSSIIHGQIKAPNIQIKDGAILNGTISMSKYHFEKLKELESF